MMTELELAERGMNAGDLVQDTETEVDVATEAVGTRSGTQLDLVQ